MFDYRAKLRKEYNDVVNLVGEQGKIILPDAVTEKVVNNLPAYRQAHAGQETFREKGGSR